MKQKRLLTMLVLLAAVVSGAWAQEETLLTTITATSTDSYSETTAGVVTVTHDNSDIYGEYGWVWWANPGSITVEAKEGYTITRCVFKQNSKTPVTVSSAPFKVSFIETANPSHPNQKKFLCQGDWNLNMNGVSSIEVYGYAPAPAPPTYSVTLAEGTEDGDKWTISPAEAAEGDKVTVTYSGEKKVKSVKAVKKGAAVTDLATITADYEAKDGETLTGTLASNVKISIAAGATVTLKDVNITNLGINCDWAGINCPGDATLVLEGTNTVCAGRADNGYNNYPGIYIAPGKTLTIQGDGTLTVYSNADYPSGAGIGGGYEISCGNIVINSGNITATGGNDAAGIGGGLGAGCGNITINGGTVTATGGNHGAGIGGGGDGDDQGTCGNITISGGTVEATGGENAAGIGGGRYNGACGTITITSGVTSVKATKGTNAPNSIGKGDNGQDITVNIENGAKVIMTPVTVTWNSPNFNSSPYTRDGVTLTAGNAASGNNFYDWGEKTFTNTIGKFTKIEIVCGDYNLDGWAQQKVGEYQEPEGPSYEIFKLTWTGNAESVTIPGKYVYSISSITFNIQ